MKVKRKGVHDSWHTLGAWGYLKQEVRATPSLSLPGHKMHMAGKGHVH